MLPQLLLNKSCMNLQKPYILQKRYKLVGWWVYVAFEMTKSNWIHTKTTRLFCNRCTTIYERTDYMNTKHTIPCKSIISRKRMSYSCCPQSCSICLKIQCVKTRSLQIFEKKQQLIANQSKFSFNLNSVKADDIIILCVSSKTKCKHIYIKLLIDLI